MASRLKLALLGPPQLWLDDEPVAGFRTSKAQALLFYLAVTVQPQPRSLLAALLWGDMSERQARVNLSKALSELRTVIGERVSIDRQQAHIQRNGTIWLDAEAFTAASAHLSAPSSQETPDLAQLAEAVTWYRDDFLLGFQVHNAPDFEQWVLAEQERLRRLLIRTLRFLVEHALEQGEWRLGIDHARRLLAIDPLREDVHRHLMLLFAQSGRRTDALAQYEACRQLLQEELDVPPDPATIALVEQIRAGELAASTSVPTPATRPVTAPAIDTPLSTPPQPNALIANGNGTATAIRHNLPTHADPFIGRQRELQMILARIAEPECRLLTLVGPGGIGKTRLALEAARRLLASLTERAGFANGVFFVPLQPVSETSGIIPAIANAVDFQFYGNTLAREQLLAYLREKQMLLLLDNFEHLLAGREYLTEILATAPGVKLLLTSRESLKLRAEWFYPVPGMAFSRSAQRIQNESTGDRATNEEKVGENEEEAIRLFAYHARRVNPNFSLAAEEEEALQICQLVDGMPLALQLAGAWRKALSCAQIVDELQRSLDLLTTQDLDMLPRHRNMRALLEHSWQMLHVEEQTILRRVSRFQGGFDLSAAREIAGADLPILATLVEKSLVQPLPAGRYQMHELLRQFAAEKLAQDETERETVATRHSRYYLKLLADEHDRLNSSEQPVALERIGRDFENISIAWREAVSFREYNSLNQALEPLYEFCSIYGRFEAGITLLAKAAEMLRHTIEDDSDSPLRQRLLGRVQTRLGKFQWKVGTVNGIKNLNAALDCADTLEDRAFALANLAELEIHMGNMESGTSLAHQAVAICGQTGDQLTLLFSLNARMKKH